MLNFHRECWNPVKKHSNALVLFAVSKQIPVVYSADRGRAEKTLGTAFAAILKHLFYLETVFFFFFIIIVVVVFCFFLGGGGFLQNICGYRYGKLVRIGVKSRKGSLASGKTLVWPISSQNLIHTVIELGWFVKHQTDPLLVQLVAV